MIEEKFIEIRDEGTTIPALAFRLSGDDEASRGMMARAGYGKTAEDQARYVILMKLDGLDAHHDPFHWGTRTMKYAHLALTDRLYHAVKNPDVAQNDALAKRCDEMTFKNLKSGDVVDVEWILGITTEKKIAEALACRACYGARVKLSEIGQKDSATVCPVCLGTGLKQEPVVMEEADTPLHRAKKKKKGGR